MQVHFPNGLFNEQVAPFCSPKGSSLSHIAALPFNSEFPNIRNEAIRIIARASSNCAIPW
jgi:hypothetical protein